MSGPLSYSWREMRPRCPNPRLGGRVRITQRGSLPPKAGGNWATARFAANNYTIGARKTQPFRAFFAFSLPENGQAHTEKRNSRPDSGEDGLHSRKSSFTLPEEIRLAGRIESAGPASAWVRSTANRNAGTIGDLLQTTDGSVFGWGFGTQRGKRDD